MANKVTSLFERISLRTRLTALSVALIGLLLGASVIGTVAVLKTYLQQNQDTVLISAADSLRSEDPITIQARLQLRQVVLPPLPTDYYIAFLDSTGSLNLGFSSSTTNVISPPNVSNFSLAQVIKTKGLPFEVDSLGHATLDNDGAGWRMIAVPLATTPGSLVVAIPTGMDNALIGRYRTIGLEFGAFLLLVSGLAIWFTITRSLRPLKEVERTAALVAEGDISKRLIETDSNTEISRVNRSLNTMLGSIEEAMSARGRTLDQMRRFVADASHELRTPLVSVRGYAELYRMGALKKKEDLDDAMQRIESEALRMTGLVENLLALARLDEAQPMAKTQVDLTKLCGEVIKDASATTKTKIVLQGFDGQTPAALELNANTDALKQVAINLISNAIRFSPAKAHIEVVVGERSGKAVLEVRDHGEGIPQELREKVFERFYRADNSRNRETGGNGLGLAIVRTLVERHQGSIVALETPGGGATFQVTLPLN